VDVFVRVDHQALNLLNHVVAHHVYDDSGYDMSWEENLIVADGHLWVDQNGLESDNQFL